MVISPYPLLILAFYSFIFILNLFSMCWSLNSGSSVFHYYLLSYSLHPDVLFFIFRYLYFMCMSIFLACMSLYHVCTLQPLGQKRALYSLELELQMVVDCHVDVETEHQSSGREASPAQHNLLNAFIYYVLRFSYYSDSLILWQVYYFGRVE